MDECQIAVDNMTAYFGRFARSLLKTDYGKEKLALYTSGKLQPDSKLTGRFELSTVYADVTTVMQVIDDAREQEDERPLRELAAREME